MKKIQLLILAAFSVYAFSGVNMAYGFSVIKPIDPSGASVNYLKASEFVKLSAKDYTAITGKKLNFLQRLSFNVTKIKMKHDLKRNPDLKVTDYINGEGRTFQVDILWLLLGVITGPIGVLIAYLAKAEPHKITSAWIGFGIFLVILILFNKSIF